MFYNKKKKGILHFQRLFVAIAGLPWAGQEGQ